MTQHITRSEKAYRECLQQARENDPKRHHTNYTKFLIANKGKYKGNPYRMKLLARDWNIIKINKKQKKINCNK